MASASQSAGTAQGRAANELLDLFKSEVPRWIAPMVKWRDAATHHGRLFEFIPMHASVVRSFKTIQEDEVVGPSMPDGTPVAAYATSLLKDAADLVFAVVRALPGVNTSLLTPAGPM